MDQPKPSMDVVLGRMQEALQAKKFEVLDRVPVSTANSRDSGEIQHRLNQLYPEVTEVNQKWHVTGDWAITSGRKYYGRALVFAKKLVRRLLRWYVNPPIVQQRDFNGSATRSINLLKDLVQIYADEIQYLKSRIRELESQMAADKKQMERRSEAERNEMLSRMEIGQGQLERRILDSLANQVQANQTELESRVGAINQRLTELWNELQAAPNAAQQVKTHLTTRFEDELLTVGDRLRRIERKINRGLGLEVKTETLARLVEEDRKEKPDLDYFLFEQRYRGSRREIKERQRIYLDFFKGKQNVLDIGCGRGEFVELLRENAVGVTGIDINPDMVDYCQDRGLPVIQGDMFSYLESVPDNSLDGIFAAQVIEHITSESLLQLVSLARLKLAPAGVLALETINPQNLVAVANWFYMDLSHIRPVHPLTLQFIMASDGFKNTQIIYTTPSMDPKIPPLRIDGTNHNLQEFNQAMEKVNDWLFGPLDYAVVGSK